MTFRDFIGIIIILLVWGIMRIVERKRHRKEEITENIAIADNFKKTLNALDRVEVKIDDSAIQNLNPYESYQIEASELQKSTKSAVLSDYVAIDVETSGLSPRSHEILSVSAVRFINQTPVELFFTYIRPRNGIPAEATQINGITEADVSDAPYFEQIIESLSGFIGTSSIVAHNIYFDMKFLYHEGLDLGYARKYYDTLDISRKYDITLASHKLSDACLFHKIGLSDSAHDSAADALACGMLFAKYIERL